MNKKAILIGSAAALGLTGLVWKVIESEILYLKSMAFINETAAARAQNLDDGDVYQRRSGYYRRLTNIAEVAQSLNPFAYIVPLRNIYDRYLSRSSYEARKF